MGKNYGIYMPQVPPLAMPMVVVGAISKDGFRESRALGHLSFWGPKM